MDKIFECKKCGAHHLNELWEEQSLNIDDTLVINRSIFYCPTCSQANGLEEIDLMTNLFDQRFWPYFLDKNQVLDEHPEMSKWL